MLFKVVNGRKSHIDSATCEKQVAERSPAVGVPVLSSVVKWNERTYLQTEQG